jgi:hypothetical protein
MPTLVLVIEAAPGVDKKALETCCLNATLICPRCGAEYARKEAFKDLDLLLADALSQTGAVPS